MNIKFFSGFSLLILVVIPVFGSINKFEAKNMAYNFQDFADFLDQYQSANTSEKDKVLTDFLAWQGTTGGGFPAIQNNTVVVFIYYQDNETVNSCAVTGDFTEWSPFGVTMERLASNINFFYKEMSFEDDARLDYKFKIDGNWRLDPHNPNEVPGGSGTNSELAMPKFEQPTEIIYRSNIQHGAIQSLNDPWTNPKVQIYLPPNYNPNGSYKTAYFTDGSEYINLGSTVNVLDNLIADKRIEPVIGIFIDPKGDRKDWYACNPDYLSYIDSLVEYIDSTYATDPRPESRLHLGDSIGGLASAYVVLERPTLFKLAGIQSGSFWLGSSYQILTKYQNASTELNLKIWFSVGKYESFLIQDIETVATSCNDKGWSFELLYLNEGHSWGTWRHTLNDLLEFFFPYPEETTHSATTNTAGPNFSYSFFGFFGFFVGIVLYRRRRGNKTY